MARDPYDSTFSEDRPLSPERVLREKERERERINHRRTRQSEELSWYFSFAVVDELRRFKAAPLNFAFSVGLYTRIYGISTRYCTEHLPSKSNCRILYGVDGGCFSPLMKGTEDEGACA